MTPERPYPQLTIELGAILCATACMVGMFVWVYFQEQQLGHQQRQVASQHIQLLESCQRLQIERKESNRTSFYLYELASAVRLTVRRRQGLLFKLVSAAQRGLAWTPLTDCERAVQIYGVFYRAPQSLPFRVRLPVPDER